LDIDIQEIILGHHILAVFAVKQILDVWSGGLEDIEEPVIVFFEIFLISAAIEIMLDQSSEYSSSSHTELFGTGVEEHRNQLVGQYFFGVVSIHCFITDIGVYDRVPSVFNGVSECIERRHILHLIEVQIALIAIDEVEDEWIFIVGLGDEIGAIGIDRLEGEQRGIVLELCIDEDMFGKDIVGEKQHIVRGFGGEAHFQGSIDVLGDSDLIVLRQ
jgi:hypothetical protein